MCANSIWESSIIPLVAAIIASLVTYLVMRSNQKHQYGQCLYREKLTFYNVLFSALLDFIKALDLNELPEAEKLELLRKKLSDLQRMVTDNGAITTVHIHSLCCGFVVAAKRMGSVKKICDLYEKTNLYEVVLKLVRMDSLVDRLSHLTQRRFRNKALKGTEPFHDSDKKIIKEAEDTILYIRQFIHKPEYEWGDGRTNGQ